MSLRKRIRDLVIETLIAVILVTAYVVYLFKVPKGSRLNWGWAPLAVNTLIVFGFLISWFRYAWKTTRYWAILGMLLLCHCAAYIFALQRVGRFPLIFYVVVNSAELVLFSRILWKFSAES
jgi:hypothetical protein